MVSEVIYHMKCGSDFIYCKLNIFAFWTKNKQFDSDVLNCLHFWQVYIYIYTNKATV